MWLADWQLWAITGASATLIAAQSAYAERRRNRRRNLDQPGFMPWNLIHICALMLACIAIGLAARGWIVSG